MGCVGWVRTVEVTHGANGWHVHVHALLIWKNQVDQEQAAVRRGADAPALDTAGAEARL